MKTINEKKVLMSDYLQDLDDNQRNAVLYNEGPSLVIAGAGSGKTRVLTYKIAYLLEQGVKPWNILALTFTNKAAREMQDRIDQQVGGGTANYLWMGTFHSIFSRILRRESEILGFSSNYTIYDSADSRNLIRTIIRQMNLDDKKYKDSVVQSRISNAKNYLITPAVYAQNSELYESDKNAQMPAIHEIYKYYWERCRQADAMDFDDLLLYTFLLLRDNPAILAKYREQFQYILVDEYQDTNSAQHTIVSMLGKEHERVCVVGDDAQSIYSFRGANIDNILNFTKVYPRAKVFKLERNYRSTQNIVSAANSLIKKNEKQISKDVFSNNQEGNKIKLFEAYSDIEEAEIVVNQLSELIRRKEYTYSDFAILYRTNAQSRVFEESMRKRGIPYRIYGGLSFYQRKEIKDAIAYFRLVVNPHDEEAFKRIINYPTRGIGKVTQDKILEAATQNSISLWKVLKNPEEYNLAINKGATNRLLEFEQMIHSFIVDATKKNAYEMAYRIVREVGIMADILKETSPESLSRKENIEELLNGINDFCNIRLEEGNEQVFLSDFLSEVSLLTDQDDDNEEESKVTLMTIHSAKGLEFSNVFVVGLEENLFPSGMSGYTPSALEEERRLFYVAITRAEENCFLSYAKSRFRYGKTEPGIPSRFLKEIDVKYLDVPASFTLGRAIDNTSRMFRTSVSQQQRPSLHNESKRDESPMHSTKNLRRVRTIPPSVNPATTGDQLLLIKGQSIEHERFGLGEVISVEGVGDNAKAKIKFQHAGEKQLLLRFARFKVLD